MHEQISTCFDEHSQVLLDAQIASDTSRYWYVWSTCVTKGFSNALRLLARVGTSTVHHLPTFAHIGQPLFKEVRQYPSQIVKDQCVTAKQHDRKILEFIGQTRRLQNCISLLKRHVIRSTPLHQQVINRTWDNICAFKLHFDFPLPSQLSSFITCSSEISYKHIANASKLL